MTIPDHTNILGIDVRTIYDDESLGTDMGCCDYEHALILLKEKDDNMIVSPQKREETYLHEIIHHIDSALDLRLKEAQVRRLSVGLYQVLHDNKLYF
jgi:hypothetical protein